MPGFLSFIPEHFDASRFVQDFEAKLDSAKNGRKDSKNDTNIQGQYVYLFVNLYMFFVFFRFLFLLSDFLSPGICLLTRCDNSNIFGSVCLMLPQGAKFYIHRAHAA